MEAISFTKTFTPILNSSRLTNFRFCTQPVSNLHGRRNSSRSKLFASSAVSTAVDKIFEDPLLEAAVNGGPEEYKKFDWFAYWYPAMPVCDLDNRLPHAKTVLGLDLVSWWDRNEGAWKVFDHMCPHRLAPLSEGRIDLWGRLQCVYHGWCFNGAGECKLISQASLDGPSVHTSKRACASVYPSTVQNERVDREGGSPVEMKLEKFGINGIDTTRFGGESKFIAPCVYYSSGSATSLRELSRKKGDSSASAVPKVKERKIMEAGISNWSKLASCQQRMIHSSISSSYWSHVVNCSSCNGAYKALKAVEVALQIVTVASIAIVAATAKQSAALRSSVVLGVTAVVLCYAASRWLSHFIYKTFHFHDYTHAPWKLLGPSS
ncbi:Protochlorophyllide-dependent translocon component 52, chloroplastic [Linum perenne]